MAEGLRRLNQGNLVPTLLSSMSGWAGLNLAVLTIGYTIVSVASGLTSGISWLLKQVF